MKRGKRDKKYFGLMVSAGDSKDRKTSIKIIKKEEELRVEEGKSCLLYTSPSPRDRQKSRMPSSA